jgi:hypothetical protein
MIDLKLLKLNNIEPIGVDNLSEFIDSLNKIFGKNIELVNKIDPNFNGYYLLPMGFTIPEDGNGLVKENINEKVFLLSVINSNIPRILEECKPAGLINWRFFKDAKATIDANVAALKSQKYATSEVLERNLEYDWFYPYPSDGTYETVAKSILKYLEIYDNYLKSKK